MKNKEILISGSGIAGLSLAYWLKQYGFNPTIIERHPTLRTGGYKIDIRGAAIEVIQKMDVYTDILALKTDIRGATIVDASGKILAEMDADLCGGRVEGDLEIMRGDLCHILYNQIGDMKFIFDDFITDMTPTVSGVYVEFNKSCAQTFDLVIGADGLHSNVRRLAFRDSSQFVKELGLYISVYSTPNFLNLDRWEIEYFEPQKFVNAYSSSGYSNAKAGFAFSAKSLQFDPRDIDQQKTLLKKAFAGSGWEVPALLAAMNEAPDFYFDVAAQIHMPGWSVGRVALVGDAGYAPSPLSGQGSSIAIVGAYVLAGELALSKGDYQLAFYHYEKLLQPFIKKNQALVKLNVAVMGDKDSSYMAWLSYHLLRLLPASWIQFLKNWGTKNIHEAANDIKLKNYPLEILRQNGLEPSEGSSG